MSTRLSHQRRGQRARIGLAAISVLVGLGACGPDIQVRTAVSPEANTLAGRRTFRVVEATKATDRDGIDGFGIKDPMVDNSITDQKILYTIKSAFEARGYRYSPDNADFEISYYATIAPILDIRSYNDGYGYGYGYYGNGGYGYAVATYDRETVVIDAVNPADKKLLWRGQGTSDYYSDPKKYMSELRNAVKAIAKKFPPAVPAVALTASR